MVTNICLSDSVFTLTLEEEELIEKTLYPSAGGVLIYGPPTSGKTTMLYKTIQTSKREGFYVYTDQYYGNEPNLNMINIDRIVKMDGESLLKNLLHPDIDVFGIDEIRDEKTSDFMFRAVSLGKLAFGTIHGNDIFDVISRLVIFGIEPNILRTHLKGMFSQRLVKKLCPFCKEQRKTSEKEKRGLEYLAEIAAFNNYDEENLYFAVGCDCCMNTGYNDRQLIVEVISPVPGLIDLVLKRANRQEVKRYLADSGSILIERSALFRIINGLTSINEVMSNI
jgi:type II secretory ATPase GspE/PulE/Tfp pilus assembly ATPase PilB-like protein